MSRNNIMLAPSVLAANMLKLGEEINAVELAGAHMVHVDVMDGHFVPNLSFGPLIVDSLQKGTNLPFDVHLMVEDADRFIKPFVTQQTRYITVHQEACTHLHNTLELIRSHGIKTGVALNPATSLFTLEYVLDKVDMVLIMTVEPGYGGQAFIPAMLQKIKALDSIRNERGLSFLIEVDGGINLDNITALADAGVDIFVAGVSIFRSGDAEAWVKRFFEALNPTSHSIKEEKL